jgi:hypothetical protein
VPDSVFLFADVKIGWVLQHQNTNNCLFKHGKLVIEKTKPFVAKGFIEFNLLCPSLKTALKKLVC